MHPNTVRLYEGWGLLGTVARSASGYRLFEPVHLERMRLARLVMGAPWAGRPIRRSGMGLIRLAAAGDLVEALAQARQHLAIVEAEQQQAEAAAAVLERWAAGSAQAEPENAALPIKDAAALSGASVDMLRNWERSGLLSVPRNPANGYRRYGQAEIDRLRIIRMLLRAGYSSMAVLRMLTAFEHGRRQDLRAVLDTPAPDEDIFTTADRWLSALAEQHERALRIIALLEAMQAGATRQEMQAVVSS